MRLDLLILNIAKIIVAVNHPNLTVIISRKILMIPADMKKPVEDLSSTGSYIFQ